MLQTNISERRDRLRERYPEWTPRTLDTFLADCASEFGERPLVLTDEQAFSYADINNQATRLANGLRSIGVEPGDRVGILMANHPEFVPLKFAIARAGAVAVPFNYLYRSEELAYVLAQSEICAGLGFNGGLADLVPLVLSKRAFCSVIPLRPKMKHPASSHCRDNPGLCPNLSRQTAGVVSRGLSALRLGLGVAVPKSKHSGCKALVAMNSEILKV